MNHIEEAHAINETELARQTNISTAALRKWRRQGTGPRYLRLGRLVRYLVRDVEIWLNEQAVEPSDRTGNTGVEIGR